MNNNKRLVTFDVVKFIAIFCVLWGHCAQYFTTEPYYSTWIYRFIYSFHMPLFMMVVGFFATSSLNKSFTDVLKHKSIQLLLPAVAVSVTICLLLRLVGIDGGRISNNVIYSFWFIKAAFLSYLVYFVSCKNPRYRLIGIILSLIASQFIFIFQFNMMYPCFIVGTIFRAYWNQIRPYAHRFSIATGITFVLMLLGWDESFWIRDGEEIYYLKDYTQLQQNIAPTYYRLAIGIIGSTFIITTCECICRRFKSGKLIGHLSTLGSYTLGIYLIQTYLLEKLLGQYLKFDNPFTFEYQFIICPAISIVLLYACIGVIKCIEANKYTALIFLGKELPDFKRKRRTELAKQ